MLKITKKRKTKQNYKHFVQLVIVNFLEIIKWWNSILSLQENVGDVPYFSCPELPAKKNNLASTQILY